MVSLNVGSDVVSSLKTTVKVAVSQSSSSSQASYVHVSLPIKLGSVFEYTTSESEILMVHVPKEAWSTERTMRFDPVSFSSTPIKASSVPGGRLITSSKATTRPFSVNGGMLRLFGLSGDVTSGGGTTSFGVPGCSFGDFVGGGVGFLFGRLVGRGVFSATVVG